MVTSLLFLPSNVSLHIERVRFPTALSAQPMHLSCWGKPVQGSRRWAGACLWPRCGTMPPAFTSRQSRRSHASGAPQKDFLRGEPGSVVMGDFLDDATLSLLPMKFLKAFLDVGLYESMCWARWGATKWVSNEPVQLLTTLTTRTWTRSHRLSCMFPSMSSMTSLRRASLTLPLRSPILPLLGHCGSCWHRWSFLPCS